MSRIVVLITSLLLTGSLWAASNPEYSGSPNDVNVEVPTLPSDSQGGNIEIAECCKHKYQGAITRNSNPQKDGGKDSGGTGDTTE